MFKKEKNGKTNINVTSKEVIMILVLFICAILIIIMALIMLFSLSTIRFRVKDFNISNLDIKKAKYKIVISLFLLNKIKWLSLKLDKEKLHKISVKMHLEKIDIKRIEKDFRLSDIRELIKLKPKLSLLNLDLRFGLEDIIITTYLIPVICTIFSLILPTLTKMKNLKHIRYKVNPIYNRTNVYYVKLDSILEIKVINLLNFIYGIYKNKRDSMYNYKKSNRKTAKLERNKIKCNV